MNREEIEKSKGNFEIKHISDGVVEILGTKYYSEGIVKSQTSSANQAGWYEGYKKGETIIRADIENCSQCEHLKVELEQLQQKQLPTDDKSMIYKMSEIEHKCTIGYDITEEEKKYFNDNYDSTLSYFKDIYEHWKYYTSKLS